MTGWSAVGVVALLMTAGCSASSGDGEESGATPSATAEASTSAPESSPSSGAGESEPDATADGGGSAGHYELEIVLENEGADPCTLQGWPGVSFVGDGDGTQLGGADGLRVYPPGEKRSLLVQNDELTLVACTSEDDELLDVQAFQPVS